MRFFFFFQAEDGIRDLTVTGVQTCALPICMRRVFASGMAVTLVGLLVVLIWPAHTEPRPPVLNLVSMEPAAMFDDIGEMWLVTLSISNPDNAPRPENTL